MWITHVYCSDPACGTGTGIDITTDKDISDWSARQIGTGYVCMPANTPASVNASDALLIYFPNGHMLTTMSTTASPPYTVTADGLTISEDSGLLSFDKVGALNNLVSWNLDAPPSGAVNAYQWIGLSWNLTRVSP